MARFRTAHRLACVGLGAAAIAGGIALAWDGVGAAMAGMADNPMLFLAVASLLCAVGVPRQAVAYAAGFAIGLWPGTALAMAAQVLGCIANIAWARVLARDWVQTRLSASGGTGRLARLDAFLSANTFNATLMLRMLPVGNNLALNLLAGASGVRATPFVAASAIGYLPQTLVFTLLGAGTRVDSTTQIALGGGLLAASLGLGWVLWRSTGASKAGASPLDPTRPGARLRATGVTPLDPRY